MKDNHEKGEKCVITPNEINDKKKKRENHIGKVMMNNTAFIKFRAISTFQTNRFNKIRFLSGFFPSRIYSNKIAANCYVCLYKVKQLFFTWMERAHTKNR